MASKTKLAGIKPRSSEHERNMADVIAVARESVKQDISLDLRPQELEQLTEYELVEKYVQIERGAIKGRLQQCRILREIRIKFGEDDRRFGEFLTTTILSELNPRTVTRMIQVANFFETKSIDGIAWSSALALAEPRNAPAAVEVYKEILGKELRPVEVVEKINNLMERIKPKKIVKKESEVINGDFTAVVSDGSTEQVKYADSASLSIEPKVRSTLALKLPTLPIVIPNNPDVGLSEDELNVAINTALEMFGNLSKMDRIRLWRALIRRDEN
jgi:hypothetical protein